VTTASPRKPKVSVYLESRYRKLERGLPQTIFWCPDCKGHRYRRKGCSRCGGYGKLTKDSVQELIARMLLPAFQARAGKFHGAGREDLDVRMLGRGRPFVFEVVGARVLDVDLEDLAERIGRAHHGRIEIEPFVAVPRSRVVHWKESKFDKVYRAEVALDADVDRGRIEALAGRTHRIAQDTPARVAHRRAALQREREVEVLRAEACAPRQLAVEVRCTHGTYVKEWISGDGGRTRPSLADALGVACQCEVLDVLEILTEQSGCA
jgi:tRNA pseudouridine synthase 10